MRTAIFYDTETQNLPVWSAPSEHPDQPHIVQLAACLVDLDSRKTLASMDVTVKPDGWTIPDEVAAIHGITTEHALAIGVPEETALDMLLSLWDGRKRIGHNITFDDRIVRIALKRFVGDVEADHWKVAPTECTQILSTPILKLPPTAKMIAARRNHHKSANLGEAYQFFTGKPLEGAHSAMVDVQACMTVYWAVQDRRAAEAVAA